jgi:hypothetical protein
MNRDTGGNTRKNRAIREIGVAAGGRKKLAVVLRARSQSSRDRVGGTGNTSVGKGDNARIYLSLLDGKRLK